MLEEQKSSSRQNLDSLIELAMERDICASEKFDEVIVIEDHLAEPLLGLWEDMSHLNNDFVLHYVI